ncbi:NmrA-like family protein [Colletotrichum plurivorum]|uniref:NmrA-like family protein n=1 Tax=Colletotrichum plurivorum TaxID=2175906 RepID=A0A8H6KAX4_9PEZI|nr:NmrA-like family protein [Colletotrichum plurivorum]
MAPTKTIAVLGATGNQGGSVVRTFLKDPSQWHVRAVTRNPSSAAAVELSKLGAEVVSASLDSVSDLEKAFTDATAIFAVTDFWGAVQDPKVQEDAVIKGIQIAAREAEESWGRNIAAAAAGVPTLERFVFSTLPGVSDLSHGRLKNVYHYDGKANIVKHIQSSLPELWSKTSLIFVGHYNGNISPGSFFAPAYNKEKDQAELEGPTAGDVPAPFIDAPGSTGPFVKALVVDEPAGIALAAFDEWQSRQETVDALTRITGKKFAYVQKSVEEMAAASPFGLEIPETFVFAAEYGFFGEKVEGWKDTLTWPSQLKNKVEGVSLEKWLGDQDWSSVFAKA